MYITVYLVILFNISLIQSFMKKHHSEKFMPNSKECVLPIAFFIFQMHFPPHIYYCANLINKLSTGMRVSFPFFCAWFSMNILHYFIPLKSQIFCRFPFSLLFFFFFKIWCHPSTIIYSHLYLYIFSSLFHDDCFNHFLRKVTTDMVTEHIFIVLMICRYYFSFF